MLRTQSRRVLLWIGFFAALTALASTASAFQPTEGHDAFEIPLLGVNPYTYTTPEIEQARQEAELSAATALGGNWRVYSWNPITSTPRYLYGSGAQIAAAFVTDNDVVAASRSVLQAMPEVFKANPAQLRYSSSPRGAGKWAVHYQQVHQGVDVWGGRVHMTFTEGGRLFVAGSNFYPNIQVNAEPSIPASVAKEIAARALPFDPATDRVEDEEKLLVLPVPISETQVDYHLVWRVRVATENPLGIWVTHVDAHDGEIVWRFNDVHFLDYQGTAEGDVQRPSYCEGQAHEEFPYLRIQISGLGNVYADADGNWTYPYAGNDPRSVTADLYSPYVDLNNVAGAEATFSGTATPGVALSVDFTDLNSQRDEKDVYAAVNDIHDFFQQFAPEFAYANQRITANVRQSGTCNAYWNGTINFYAAGGGCANTGEIMGVVYHEFGHGVQNAILGGQGNEGLGEGNSDIISNLMLRESIIGRGFYLNNCTAGIRNSFNSLQYPEDLNGQVHHDGQIIAGFQWDAMEVLRLMHGDDQGVLIAATNWHYGRVLEHPYYQPDQVLATFIADDDDGNLDNGTPNYDAYAIGAENHGYDYPEVLIGVIIQHTPLATRETDGDAEVVATIYSTEAGLEPDSLRLNYRVNGGNFISVVLEHQVGDEYAATIPSLTSPSEVEYYLRARDLVGNTRTAPTLAPDVLYAFDVATVYDDIETDEGWVVNLEGGDNATTGQWERVDPNGTSAQPEDDHTPDPGTICWVTGNAPPGSGDGTNDIDGGTTTLYTPVYELGGAAMAKVKYYRWYSNDRGATPGTDTWIAQVRNNGGAWVNMENTMLSSNAWELVSFDLAAEFGAELGSVQFKFIGSDLGDGSLVEAAIDDFELLALISADAPEPAADGLRFALMGSSPNPARAGTSIRFQIPVNSRVSLKLFDVAGRQVRTVAEGGFAPGVHTVNWDGKDDAGHESPSGVYFYRLEAGEFSATRSLVLTR